MDVSKNDLTIEGKGLVESFSRREPIFKRFIYESLTGNTESINRLSDYIKSVLDKTALGNLQSRTREFFKALEVLDRKYPGKNEQEKVRNIIIGEYQKNEAYNNALFAKKMSDLSKRDQDELRKGLPSIHNAKSNISVVGLLRAYRDRFEELDRELKENGNYAKTVEELLSRHLLPSSEMGRKIIEENGVDYNFIAEYFELLDRISLGLSIDENQRELVSFINGLTKAEVEFIEDLEAEGLTLMDDEGQQMLNYNCVNKDKIIRYYELMHKQKLNKSGDEVKKYKESLNEFERIFIEDAEAASLKPGDPEFAQMLSERTVDVNKIIKYFALRDKLTKDVQDYREFEASVKGLRTPQKEETAKRRRPVSGTGPAPVIASGPARTTADGKRRRPVSGEGAPSTNPATEGAGTNPATAPEAPVEEEEKTEGPVVPTEPTEPEMTEDAPTKGTTAPRSNPSDWHMNDAYLRSLERDYEHDTQRQRMIARNAAETLTEERRGRFFDRVRRFFGNLRRRFTREETNEPKTEEAGRSR